MTEQTQKQVQLMLQGINIETSPCTECGLPFMLVVVGGTPVGSVLNPLVVPHKTGKDGKDTMPVKPVVAWRLCMRCLHREVNVPQGQGWVNVETYAGRDVATKPMLPIGGLELVKSNGNGA